MNILYLKSKFRQFGTEIKFSLDLLENVYLSQFVGAENEYTSQFVGPENEYTSQFVGAEFESDIGIL